MSPGFQLNIDEYRTSRTIERLRELKIPLAEVDVLMLVNGMEQVSTEENRILYFLYEEG